MKMREKNDFYDTPSLEETKWINRNRWINDEIPCRPRSGVATAMLKVKSRK